MLFFVAENAYGRRSHIIIRRSQSSEAYATYVYHSSTLSRSTSRTVYTVLDVDESILYSSHVADVAARYRITKSGARGGDDSESSTGRSAACTGASAEYDGAADDGAEEEEVRQRGMAWEKTDTNAPCIIERITVRTQNYCLIIDFLRELSISFTGIVHTELFIYIMDSRMTFSCQVRYIFGDNDILSCIANHVKILQED